jgi:alkylhydroperoxidase/carboxymuconolactone decarboxylase family protein YurZ
VAKPPPASDNRQRDALLAQFAPDMRMDQGAGVLDEKTRALILVAVNAATTHLHQPAIRAHMAAALAAGATQAEIVEVLELVTALGLHTWTIGAPLLVEALRANGESSIDAPLTERQERLKAQFIAERSGWSEPWEHMLRLSPDFFALALQLVGAPWKTGPLPPKIKELIYVAIDAAATHLYPRGLRIHIRTAMKYGATTAEIVDVFRIVSTIGFQALEVGLPLLAEALKAEC